MCAGEHDRGPICGDRSIAAEMVRASGAGHRLSPTTPRSGGPAGSSFAKRSFGEPYLGGPVSERRFQDGCHENTGRRQIRGDKLETPGRACNLYPPVQAIPRVRQRVQRIGVQASCRFGRGYRAARRSDEPSTGYRKVPALGVKGMWAPHCKSPGLQSGRCLPQDRSFNRGWQLDSPAGTSGSRIRNLARR